MRSYRQYCPIARASEILAERWTPIILRNMLVGCNTFSEILDGAPGLSKTLLTQRLRTMERLNLIERHPTASGRGHTYHLTTAGHDLAPVFEAMGTWAATWLEVTAEHLHPYVVLWLMSRFIPDEEIADERLVFRFDLSDPEPPRRLWVVMEPRHREICLKNPGYDENLVFTTDRQALAYWHMGWLPIDQAIKDGRIRVEGPRALIRRFIDRLQGLDPAAGIQPAFVRRELQPG